MAYVAGKSGRFEIAGTPFSCRVTWNEKYDISTNTSIVGIESVEVKCSSWRGVNYYPSGNITVNGEAVVSFSSALGTHIVSISNTNTYYAITPTGTTGAPPWMSSEIAHNTDGTKSIAIGVSFGLYTISGDYGSGKKITGTNTIALTDIPRFATLTAAPNFNDEENPTITYTNPAGNSVTSLEACISLTGTNDDVVYRNIDKSGSTYTFNLTNAERDVLRAATTGANSRTVKFFVRSVIGGNDGHSVLSRTFTIKDPNPTIDPTITDENSATVALTGDSGVLVRYFSNANISIGAQAVKKATLTSQKVTCGNKNLNGDGTIEAVESGTFVFTATDNRGNTTQKTVETDFVQYVKLSCILGNKKPNTEGILDFEVNGSYFKGSFGSVSNTLAVYYRYKVSGGTYGNWKPMNVSTGDGSYTATANLTGLDYQTSYVFQAYAVDNLATVYSAEKIVKAAPVFDWGESDFKFNVPVFDQFGSKLVSAADVSDVVRQSDMSDVVRRSAILDLVFPINSIYISYSHTSPASLFGGTWTRVVHSTGAGTFLYGSTAAAVIGECGGEASHTHALGDSAYAKINHHDSKFWFKEVDGVSYTAAGSGTSTGAVVSSAQSAAVPLGGATNSANNFPPYTKVSIWRRTA